MAAEEAAANGWAGTMAGATEDGVAMTAHLDHGEAMEADTEVGEADGAEKATVVAAKWPAVEALEAEEVGVAAMPHTK